MWALAILGGVTLSEVSAHINIDDFHAFLGSTRDRFQIPQVEVYATVVLGAILLRHLFKFRVWEISERMVWIIIGALYALLLYYNVMRRWLDVTWTIQPSLFLTIHMPVLLFHASYNIDLHILKRSAMHVVLLGVLGTLLTATLLSFVMSVIIVDTQYPWGYTKSFIFGMVMVPVAATRQVRVLNDFEKHKHLVTVLDGEELLGTMTVLCAFEIAVGVEGMYVTQWYHVLMLTLRFLIGGVLLGTIMGMVVCWITRCISGDGLNVVVITLTATYTFWYIAEYMLGYSGSIACVILGLMMSKEKSSMSIEVDAYVSQFWVVYTGMINVIVFVTMFGMCLDRALHTAPASTYSSVVITYVLSNVARFVSLLVMTPLLSRTGYGMTFKNVLLIAWCNTKGVLPLLLSFIVFHQHEMKTLGAVMIAHAMILITLCTFVNRNTMSTLLRMSGFTHLSTVRKSNMNNCMKILHEKRDAMLAILKMNRFLSDANWPIVTDATVLKHPYKIKIVNEEGVGWGARESVCPRCSQTIMVLPTQREIKDMTTEARLRVLKTQRISFIRQYESGMLSKAGIRSLLQAVEVSMDSTETIIKLDDYFKIIKKKNRNDKIRKGLILVLRFLISDLKQPQKPCPQKCFVFLQRRVYICSMALLIVVHMSINIVECVNEDLIGVGDGFFSASTILYVLFAAIYLADIVVKLLASCHKDLLFGGIMAFLRLPFNILDVLITCVLLTMILYRIYNYSVYQLRGVLFLKMLRLIVVSNIVIMRVVRYFENHLDMRIMFAYDVGKALVTGYEESIDTLNQMVENKYIRESIKKQIEDDRLAVTKELGLIQKYSPWIAISIKTKQATRATLNHMKEAISELKVGGFVDDFEYEKLKESIDNSLKQARILRIIEMSNPKLLFHEIQWIGTGSVEMCEFLYDNVHTHIWDAGDVIISSGQKSKAVFILVTGLFRISYTPEKGIAPILNSQGLLPIVDYISSSNFEDTFEEFIFSGNSLGELSVITGRPYNSTVIAEAPSQAYVISTSVMLDAMEKDKNPIFGLEARLWKFVSLMLAGDILQYTPAYLSLTQEEIRLVLISSFVPNLQHYNVFVSNELIQDLVLIEGIVMDQSTKLHYYGPCYIPRTVLRLALPKSGYAVRAPENVTNVKILIIPNKDVEEFDIMEKVELSSELKPNASMSCLISNLYSKRIRKRKRALFNRKEKPATRKMSRVVSMNGSDDGEWTIRSMGIQVIDDESEKAKNVDTR